MSIRFTLNGRPAQVTDLPPTTTLLEYLRRHRHLCGTKEGCAEGDCGACTVAVLEPGAAGGPAWRAVDSCLVLLPSLQGRSVVTVEGLAEGRDLHPAQQAVVEELGSQCGYCTPGFVMSLFEATYRQDLPEGSWKQDDQLCGNLCRCTGYRPLQAALRRVAGSRPADRFAAALEPGPGADAAVDYRHAAGRFVQPTDLAGLWAAIQENPDYRLVCGATDLGLEVTKRRATYPCLISLAALRELSQFQAIEGGYSIGAAVVLSDLEACVEGALPPLARMLRYFASRQIKSRASVGGNLCNASPIGDLAPALIALRATAVLLSAAGERRLPLEDFFLSYRKTALEPGEILGSVEVPAIEDGWRAASYKVSKRRELDISAVSAGMAVRLGADGRVVEARLAYGGMAATTKRARAAEAALVGRPLTSESAMNAADRLGEDFAPLSDHRGSAWYRGAVARNLLLGFALETVRQALPRLPDHPSGTVILSGETA